MKMKIIIICIIILLATTATLPLIGTMYNKMNHVNASVELYQINYKLDGQTIDNSQCGVVKLTYHSDPDYKVLYFNFAIKDNWLLRNIPVRSGEETTGEFTIYMSFNLGVLDGVDVNLLEYASDLTYSTLQTAPVDIKLGYVNDTPVILNSGEKGINFDYIAVTKNPTGFIGTTVTNISVKPSTIPVNQDCDLNECAPAAISNSLKTLKKTHPVELKDLTDDPLLDNDDTDIETMKPVCDWDNGAYAGTADSPDSWWNKKKEFMDKSSKYPITTEIIKDKSMFNYVMSELNRCQDVELREPGHVVMVTGIFLLPTGKYVLEIAHDSAQGSSGGNIFETIEYDPDTNTFHGGAFGCFENKHYNTPADTDTAGALFIIECPEETENKPPWTPGLTGKIYGKIQTPYEITIKSFDPDKDFIYFYTDWNDGFYSLIGPYESNETTKATHIYSVKGTYQIKVKAIDEHNAESEWATLEVIMPKSKEINKQLFLQRFFQCFPFFEKILNQYL